MPLFSSCGYKQETNDQLTHIKIETDEIQDVNLSQICSNINYVKLETNSKSFIVGIDKIEYFENKFYIFDRVGKKILAFDNNGHYICNIGNLGHAPGEYTNPMDFIIDEDNNVIKVYDIGQSKILSFNYSGQFLSEQKFPFKFLFFEQLKTEGYIIQTRKINNTYNDKACNYDVLFVDSKEKLIHKYFSYDPRLKDRGGAVDLPKIFTKHSTNKDIYLAKLFNDTVYQIKESTYQLEPRFIFDYGKTTLPIKQRTLSFDESIKLINSPGKYSFGHILIGISDSTVCFTYGYKDPIFSKRILGLYFPYEGKTFSYQKIKNDIDDGIFLTPITTIGNNLVSVIYHNNINKSNYANSKVFQDWQENDNPILMLSKIKFQIIRD